MLILHNPPESEILYSGYSVKVNDMQVRTPAARVSAIPYNTVWPGRQRPVEQTELAPMLIFEADEAVTVTVSYPSAPSEVIVRPLSRNVKADIAENTATLTLTEPGSYTVEADGFHEALHVFFNPVKDFEEYAKGVKNVIRYGAGVHNIGRVELFSDTTVIIDRDAYIYGSFIAINAENVTVCGYGILDGSLEERTSEDLLLPYKYGSQLTSDREELLAYLKEDRVLDGLVRFYRCKNIRLEGVVLRDASTFAVIPANCSDAVIENVKAIGMWRYNSDGIDLFNCQKTVIRNCFLRDFDDCIVLKGICGWDAENMEDILVEGCVVWCDWGRNLEIGAETNAPIYRNIVFRDCDCIHGCHIFCDIQHYNRAEIFDVTFEDIRCEYTKHQLGGVYQHDMEKPYPDDAHEHPVLMAIPIVKQVLYSDDGLKGFVHDIKFRNIQIITDSPDLPVPESIFKGLDEEHKVSRVSIENVTFNTKRLSYGEGNIKTNEFAQEISFS